MSPSKLIKGIIRQIVPWEQRGNYIGLDFFMSNNGDGFDMITMSPLLGRFTGMSEKPRGKLSRLFTWLKPAGLLSMGEVNAIIEDWPLAEEGLSIWVPRPNSFKKGDIVTIGVMVEYQQ